MSQEVLKQSERYVVPLAEYDSPSSRIRGFQDIEQLGLNGPAPMLILTHDAFARYNQQGDLTRPVEEAIRQAFRQIRSANLNRGAYIGRAFYVPGIDNPHGPRTAAIYEEDQYVAEVKKFFEYVRDNGYHESPEANIALILHPFINVADRREYYGGRRLHETELLPWSGGYAVLRPVAGCPERIEIAATFGPDEAVQSVPSDRYLVDPIESIVLSKDTAYKDFTLIPDQGTQYRLTPIPDDFRSKQSLTDEEIIAVAKEAWKAFKKRPDARVEFILQPDGVYVREIAPRGIIDIERLFKFKEEEVMTGSVVVIRSIADLGKIIGRETIVYLAPEAFRERTTDVFARLVGLGLARLVAFTYGRSTTSHPTKVITEAGHSVLPWGPHQLKDGTRVRISRRPDGSPHVEYLDPYRDAVVSLDETAILVDGSDGEKVARIARMRAAGITTPGGFVIRSEALWRWMSEAGISQSISTPQTLDAHDPRFDALVADIQSRIDSLPFPQELQTHLQAFTQRFGGAPWIVRSTGPEDVNGQSRAGLYVSTPNVAAGDIEGAAKQTLKSYFSRTSIEALRRTKREILRIPVAVLVQHYLPRDPRALGAVVFTHEDDIIIECAQGSPEPIVSHQATDYVRITVSRKNGSFMKEVMGNPSFSIPDAVITSVLAVAGRIENLFRSYQDIELVVMPDRTITVFQARPL